jgi:hypothetical protein
MAIANVEAIQGEETKVITDFKVTFKMIRTTTAAETNGLSPIASGRAANQSAGLTDLGTSTPQSSTSMSAGITSIA